jgi:hypothetical protein
MRRTSIPASVVVLTTHLPRLTTLQTKGAPELVVHSDAVPPFLVAPQCFQPVSGRHRRSASELAACSMSSFLRITGHSPLGSRRAGFASLP